MKLEVILYKDHPFFLGGYENVLLENDGSFKKSFS